MPRKNMIERRAKKLSQLEKLKEELAKLEGQTAERIGRLAVKAGLGELAIEDADLVKEFEAIANRFRNGTGKSPAKDQGAVAQG